MVDGGRYKPSKMLTSMAVRDKGGLGSGSGTIKGAPCGVNVGYMKLPMGQNDSDLYTHIIPVSYSWFSDYTISHANAG